eukprot:5906803-Pyramimonas_sp.AAC.1
MAAFRWMLWRGRRGFLEGRPFAGLLRSPAPCNLRIHPSSPHLSARRLFEVCNLKALARRRPTTGATWAIRGCPRQRAGSESSHV